MAAHYSSAMFWEVNPAIASAIGMAGTIVAMGMFLSPVRTFQRIIQRRSTEEFSPFPYASTFLSCSIWLFYSLPFITPDRLSPLLTNCLGVTFELVYLAIFLLFAHDAARKRAVKMVAGVFSFVFCFVFGVLLCIEPDKRSSFIGLFAAVFTVLMYGSPLAVMGTVIKTLSVEFMPFSLSLLGFVCSSTWAAYGIYVQDLWIILPNLLGSLLGLMQLILYAYIVSKRGTDDDGFVCHRDSHQPYEQLPSTNRHRSV